MKSMTHFFTIWHRLASWFAGLALIVMMTLTAVDVGARYLIKRPLVGTADLTELLMIVIIFLSLSDTAASNGHLSVEVVFSRFPLRVQHFLKGVTLFLSGVAVAVTSWRLAMNGLATLQTPEYSPIMEISKTPFLITAAVGCAFLTAVLVMQSIKELYHFAKAIDRPRA